MIPPQNRDASHEQRHSRDHGNQQAEETEDDQEQARD